MVEKKGFFRRVFSFGSEADRGETAVDHAPEAAPERVPAPIEEAPAPATASQQTAAVEVAEGDAPRTASEMLPDKASGPAQAVAIGPEPSEPPPAEPALDETDAPAIVPADEPEWLAPDAPEPEADFSWLDAPVVDPAEPEERAHIPAASALAGTASLDATPETASEIADDIAAPGDTLAVAGTAATEEDFSFLAPDAPLPEVEEEADFSWLEPDAPLPEAPASDDFLSEGPKSEPSAAETLPGMAARSLPTDAGFRLREAAVPVPVAPAARVPWFDRLREGLARSSSQLSGSITALFTKRRLDEETLQDFEDVLIQADLGVETALRITDRLSEGRFGKEISGEEVRSILADEVEATLRPVAVPLELDLEKKPHVILVVGVNGTGKTTTIGKLAAKLTRGGLKVTLCAGDTFRAAAVEQLKIWGERTGSTVIAKAIGADAAGLAFEAYDAAVENGSDVLIIDTAGRLQNRTELMAELEKIVRVLQRREPDAPHTVLQTLDATTGQNALNQVEIFRNVAGVNGLVMTKLDGTARGGILVAIAAKFKLPVYFIGVGEGIDDLEPFKARDFAMAIAGRTA